MMKVGIRRSLCQFALLIAVALVALAVGDVALRSVQATSSCHPWFRCPITQYFGQNEEHGTDVYTHGLPVTALLPGVVTFDKWVCWAWNDCVQDITWKLSNPQAAHGEPYAYVQIRTSKVHVGQHITATTVLGDSGSFIEYGVSPDHAYGVSNWRWGVNPLFIINRARAA